MDRGTERRASVQSCPGSPAAVSNCCLPAARLPGISLPVGPCSSLHSLVPPLGGKVLSALCVSVAEPETPGAWRSAVGEGGVVPGLGSWAGVVVSQLVPSLVSCHYPLRPSCQKGVCEGVSIKDHTWFVLSPCLSSILHTGSPACYAWLDPAYLPAERWH